jgi:hypothetical protein
MFLKQHFVFGISDICIRSGKACGPEERCESERPRREGIIERGRGRKVEKDLSKPSPKLLVIDDLGI